MQKIEFFMIVYLLVLFYKVVDYLVDPFVAGTSAADPESLSVSNAPFIWTNLFKFHGRKHTPNFHSI